MIEKDLLFDKRIVDRNLKKGLVKKTEVDEHMKGLDDLQGQFEDVEVAVQEGEFDLRAPEIAPEDLEDELDD